MLVEKLGGCLLAKHEPAKKESQKFPIEAGLFAERDLDFSSEGAAWGAMTTRENMTRSSSSSKGEASGRRATLRHLRQKEYDLEWLEQILSARGGYWGQEKSIWKDMITGITV